ncbi:hypothetical protein ACFFGH_11300 [Lysobacter korlensis]|uniref:Thioredoxin n=1 Tax=Lysobacter korlensis TaxID=553636 RepID=A0ABV6RN56_9GAMM
MQTRRVLAEAAKLVPAMELTELDIVRDASDAERERVRSTPTVVVHGNAEEVFRAEGVPSLNQVLVALAKAV